MCVSSIFPGIAICHKVEILDFGEYAVQNLAVDKNLWANIKDLLAANRSERLLFKGLGFFERGRSEHLVCVFVLLLQVCLTVQRALGFLKSKVVYFDDLTLSAHKKLKKYYREPVEGGTFKVPGRKWSVRMRQPLSPLSFLGCEQPYLATFYQSSFDHNNLLLYYFLELSGHLTHLTC